MPIPKQPCRLQYGSVECVGANEANEWAWQHNVTKTTPDRFVLCDATVCCVVSRGEKTKPSVLFEGG